jgi:hypothetical protein
MAFSFLYLALRALLGALVRSRRGLQVKDVELLVLRHELEILRRQVARPKLSTADRALLAAAGCHLPRSSRGVLLVTPRTLLRWHRALVRRKWRQPPVGADGRSCRLRFGSWCCDSHARTRAGVTGGSLVSWPSSASASRRRASGGCLLMRSWNRRRAATARAGASSCERRRPASSPVISSSSPVISSQSRASCFAATTCSSSSDMRADAFGWPAARRTRPARG